MKRVDMKDVLNDSSNELTIGVLNSVPQIRFVSKIDEALQKRGLTQAKLATLTGLRPTTISEVVNGSRLALTKSHIASIMIALRITDIREIIDIEFAPETVEQFEKESKEWIEDGEIPESVEKMYADHAKELFSPDIKA
ncbi:TPA: helix-turn-helix domain-containing protein [Clostridium botulinum]|uniref:helix-turn-helix domain-containing protein n=1 Tax=Clostridium botulinum TaxID=1491 RepID=UPI001C9A8D0B|nr:helix-turn-helix transcriptional regulator [Clostridium botulinum]